MNIIQAVHAGGWYFIKGDAASREIEERISAQVLGPIRIAVAPDVYDDCVAWTAHDIEKWGGLPGDEAARLWHLVWMASMRLPPDTAIRKNVSLRFAVLRRRRATCILPTRVWLTVEWRRTPMATIYITKRDASRRSRATA